MTSVATPFAAPADSMTTLTPAQRRALVAGSIGNAVEWVDWAVYSAFAPIFASQFFPSADPTAALLSTLAAFAGSWQQVSVGAGTLLASLLGAILTTVLGPQELQAWGWRIAFGIGGLLGLVGLWLRVSVEETEHFTAVTRSGRRKENPLKAMLLEHPGAALRVVGITIPGTLTYYIWVSYMAPYASTTTGIPLNQAFLANT